MSEISQLLREGPADSALAFRAADEIERLTPYVEAFRREETRADKLAQQVDELREQLADAESVIFKLNGGEEFQSLMRVNNGLREQLSHTEADFEACNEISCRRWEEIQRLREQLESANAHLEEEEANAGRAWSSWENAKQRIAVLELVIREEIHPQDCADDANRMIVEGIHHRMSPPALTDEQRVYAGGGDGTFNENEPDDEFVRKARAVHTDEKGDA